MKAVYSQETMLKETAVKILTKGLLLEVKETLPKELTFSVAVLNIKSKSGEPVVRCPLALMAGDN